MGIPTGCLSDFKTMKTSIDTRSRGNDFVCNSNHNKDDIPTSCKEVIHLCTQTSIIQSYCRHIRRVQ